MSRMLEVSFVTEVYFMVELQDWTSEEHEKNSYDCHIVFIAFESPFLACGESKT